MHKITMPLTLLPPARDRCQVCAVRHSAELPHDADSLYYQVRFARDHGRPGTWADAMAHCDDELRELWTSILQERGRWSAPPEGIEPVAELGEAVGEVC